MWVCESTKDRKTAAPKPHQCLPGAHRKQGRNTNFLLLEGQSKVLWRGLQVTWAQEKILSERFKHSLSIRQNTNRSDRIFPEPGNCPRDTCYLFLAISIQALTALHTVFLHQLQHSEATYILHKSSLFLDNSLHTFPTSRLEHHPTTFVAEILLCVFRASSPQKSSTTSHSYKVWYSKLSSAGDVTSGSTNSCTTRGKKNLHLLSRNRKIWS